MRFIPDAIEYPSGDRLGLLAAFDDEFLRTLPAEGKSGFEAVILDRVTGQRHAVAQPFAAYEEREVFDPEVADIVTMHVLMGYFYVDHWCGCHRICDIENAGGSVPMPNPDPDDGCPSGRFIVERLTHPAHPGLVLFRETLVEPQSSVLSTQS